MISVIVLAFEVGDGKRRDHKDQQQNRNNLGTKNNKKGEDTCVSGYCLDPTYNKLELPSSEKNHVRINLEVSLQ